MDTEAKNEHDQAATRKSWVRPELKPAGHAGDMLQGSGAKLSNQATDPGDTRKPSGQG